MTALTAAALGEVAAALREVAATEIMPRFRRLAAGEVRSKSGPLDLVTVADEAAERRTDPWLRRRFPGCAVIGEEAASADPSLLAQLADAELAFVVDPIDGTSNYAAGVPLFGIMVAAIVRGEVVGAIIHDPLGDDTAFALRGEGAWIEAADGRRNDLRVTAPVPVARMTGAASWRFLPDGLKQTVCRNLPRLGPPAGTSAAPRTNTACSPPATATSCCSTG